MIHSYSPAAAEQETSEIPAAEHIHNGLAQQPDARRPARPFPAHTAI